MALDVGAEHEERRRHPSAARMSSTAAVAGLGPSSKVSAQRLSPAIAGRRQRMRPSGSKAGMPAERLIDADRDRDAEQHQPRPQRRRRRQHGRRRARSTASDSATRKIQLRSGAPTLMIVLCTPSGTSSPPASHACRPPGPATRPRRWRCTSSACSSPARAGADSCARSAATSTRAARDAGDAGRHRRRQPDAGAGRRGLPHRAAASRRPRHLAQATVAAVWDRLSELPPILVLAAMSLGRRPSARGCDGAPTGDRRRRWRSRSPIAGHRAVARAPLGIRSGADGARACRRQSRRRPRVRRRRRLLVAAVAPGLPAADVRDARLRRGAVADADRDAVDPGDARRRRAGDRGTRSGRGRADRRADGVRRRPADRRGGHRARARDLVRVQHRDRRARDRADRRPRRCGRYGCADATRRTATPTPRVPDGRGPSRRRGASPAPRTRRDTGSSSCCRKPVPSATLILLSPMVRPTNT